MTNTTLAQSYLEKSVKRLKILKVLLDDAAYSDVVREAQEIVELALKAILRHIGIDPPKWHDVGPILTEHRDLLPAKIRADADALAEISKKLRKEREFSFYGDEDFIPTEQYSIKDARQAIAWAKTVVVAAKYVISPSRLQRS